MTSLSLHEIEQHIATQPVDAKRIKGLALFVTGRVAAAGTVDAGTGFTVNRSATGVYDITFTVAFPAAPTVLATMGDASSSQRICRVTGTPTTTTATVTIASASTGVNQNEPFNFVAFPTT